MKEVYVVTGKRCKYCEVQKKWLKDAGIPFKELDIEKNQDFCNKLRIMGLPTTIIMANDRPIHSFIAGTVKPEEVLELLGA